MSDSPIIEVDSIDSTNNYAMQLIDANTAHAGLTIVAQSQTGGKGQRGRTWVDTPGQSLLMSVVACPGIAISAQFAFNALIAVSIADVLKPMCETWDLKIKWPNDIIINDKKAGGILIENVLRGSRWVNSVIGLGLNVKQAEFPTELPFATSLKIGSGMDMDITMLRDSIRKAIMDSSTSVIPADAIMRRYNEHLYKRGQKQLFSDSTGKWEATIIGAGADGSLQVQMAGGRMQGQDADGSLQEVGAYGRLVNYYHGQVVWEWGN